jgi:ABC-type dipeptide/oligopeptide/nickel transport system permease subunit
VTAAPKRPRAAQLILMIWLVLGLAGSVWPDAPRLLRAMGHDLGALVAVLLLALVAGVPLGAVAGSGPRWVDVTLAFMTDWVAAVPVVLLLAFLRPAGVTPTGALILLGLLRALEVAWVVRSALLRGALLDTTWAPRSLGYMPLSVFIQERLPSAAVPALAHLALTPVWVFLLDAVGMAAGLGPASSEGSLGALAAGPTATPIAGLVSFGAVVALTWSLHRLGDRYGLRLARK